MKVTFLHKNLSQEEERGFVKYVNSKMRNIKPLLQNYDKDTCSLRAAIEKFDKHDAYNVEFLLTIPSKKILSTEASHTILKAVDLSKDRLVAQIKKHKDALKEDREHGSIKQKPIKEETLSLNF